MKKLLLIFTPFLLVSCNPQLKVDITSFEECVAAGNPVMESYPQQCRTADGKHFVQDIGNELEKMDLIRLDSPRPNQVVASPITVEGEARGTWFFEGDFPIVLTDENGNELAISHATAQGEWMTENFVQFKEELAVDVGDAAKGMLILKKDNPSGLPENDDALRVPVRFR